MTIDKHDAEFLLINTAKNNYCFSGLECNLCYESVKLHFKFQKIFRENYRNARIPSKSLTLESSGQQWQSTGDWDTGVERVNRQILSNGNIG
jgi:hypothetical protein